MSFARLCYTAARSMTSVAAAGGATRAVQRLPKPNLKNHFRDHLVKTFYYGLPFSTVCVLMFYVLFCQKRYRVYANYFDKRTPEQEMEDFERMRALGVFQGAPPDGEEYLDFSE